jgi:hypothetical protein
MASGKITLHHDIIGAYSVRGQILKAPARKTRIGFGLCFTCSEESGREVVEDMGNAQSMNLLQLETQQQ